MQLLLNRGSNYLTYVKQYLGARRQGRGVLRPRAGDQRGVRRSKRYYTSIAHLFNKTMILHPITHIISQS